MSGRRQRCGRFSFPETVWASATSWKDRVGRGEEFFDVLRCVADGGTVVDPEVVRQLLRRRRVPLERLATREREVLALIAEGGVERGDRP